MGIARGVTGRVLVCVLAIVSAACSAPPPARQPPAPAPAPTRLRAEVIGQVPHDPRAFTQGLELVDGVLYEGTGLNGASSMRAVDPATGEVRQQVALPAELFGEGITVVDQTIWQLTWQQGVAIRWDRATLRELGRVSYPGEGWGLCHDTSAGRLVMSDGTDRLTFRDPVSFEQVGEVRVRSAGAPVTRINELECTGDVVYANVWQTDLVVRIDPASGQVTADVDLSGLLPAEQRAGADVLNGIAAVPETDEFLVTGKYWPTMFRVRFVPTTG